MHRSTRIAAALATALTFAGSAWAQETATPENSATVLQGGVARWSGGDAKECGVFGRRYGAIDGVCFYPVDMKAKTGVHEIAMWNEKGTRTLGTLTVGERECTETEITLDDDTFVNVSTENRTLAAAQRGRIVKAVAGNDKPPGFAIPLGPPAEGVATKDRSDFCELRIYNGGDAKSRHTGLDYPLSQGTPVVAGADGIITLAEEQFYTGNTVVVDHGGGLVTMVFHLADLAVEEGAGVKRGDKLGSVGSTGRSTGPHLHYGARYQNQRIDIGALIGDPAKLPGVGEPMAVPAEDTEAVETDNELPSAEDKRGEDAKPAEVAAKEGDEAAEDAQSGNQAGEPEAADSVESKDDRDAVEQDGEDGDEPGNSM